jgi:hypothetical protein
MNVHEERAWKLLIELGAREFSLGGKHALDLKPIRATSEKKLSLLVQGVLGVVGRSGANRRHVDRRGCPVYVVTDFYTLNAATAEQIREDETKAFTAKLRRRKEESP